MRQQVVRHKRRVAACTTWWCVGDWVLWLPASVPGASEAGGGLTALVAPEPGLPVCMCSGSSVVLLSAAATAVAQALQCLFHQCMEVKRIKSAAQQAGYQLLVAVQPETEQHNGGSCCTLEMALTASAAPSIGCSRQELSGPSKVWHSSTAQANSHTLHWAIQAPTKRGAKCRAVMEPARSLQLHDGVKRCSWWPTQAGGATAAWLGCQQVMLGKRLAGGSAQCL